MNKLLVCLVASTALLAGCSKKDSDQTATPGADASVAAAATASAPAVAALGLTEQQLLDADVVNGVGVDFGDVEAVLRDASGAVDRVNVKLDKGGKMVTLKTADLTTTQDGNDWDLVTKLTREEISALPAAK